MAKKKNKSISLVDLPEIDVAASGSSTLGTNLSSLANLPFGSDYCCVWVFGSYSI